MPSSVQSLSHVRLLATPWTAAHQASLSITNSQSPFKPMSIESVMLSNHLTILPSYHLSSPSPPALSLSQPMPKRYAIHNCKCLMWIDCTEGPNTHPLLYHGYCHMPFHAFFSHKRGSLFLQPLNLSSSLGFIWGYRIRWKSQHSITGQATGSLCIPTCSLALPPSLGEDVCVILPEDKASMEQNQVPLVILQRPPKTSWPSAVHQIRAGAQLTWNFPSTPNLNECYWWMQVDPQIINGEIYLMYIR